MKTYLLLVLSAACVALALTQQTHPRGCIYALGNCVRECEEGTHSYSIGCGVLKTERTCESPDSTADERGIICDYSRCDCDEPTVRDTSTGKCVMLKDCPGADGKEQNSN